MYSTKISKIILRPFFASLTLLLIAGFLSSSSCVYAQGQEETPELLYFYSLTCHKCAVTKEEVMPRLEKHFSPRVKFEYLDIAEGDNYKKLFTLKRNFKADAKSVFPVIYFRGKFIDGRDEDNLTYESLGSFVAQGMGRRDKEFTEATIDDIVKYFKSLGPLAIMSAGLVDGINPCAFTVIVFFMSFLFFQGYSKRNIATVGLSFMTAVFITYVLLGFGLFGWLHVMKGFTLFTRIISIAIGVFSICLGILSIYDAILYVKKGKADDMVLHLPKSIKAKIQSVIGDEYRVTKEGGQHRSTIKLIASALAVGFIISIFESLCTGQLYLPTIMFILKTTPYKLQAFGYLVLYNLMFMVPIAAIFAFAMAGVSSQAFAAVMKKNMLIIKLLLAAMFIFLGVSLVHADNTIAEPGMTQEEIRQDPHFYDFGQVKEGDILKHTFTVENDEDVIVNIEEINTSCACAEPKAEKMVIEPGESVQVEIAFDTKGYKGKKKRHLFVHTDSKTNPLVIFEIQADVQ